MFVNPWNWYIINDEMPTGPNFNGKELIIICICIGLLFLWGFGISLFSKYVLIYGSVHFFEYYILTYIVSLSTIIGLIIWLLPKVLRKF